MTKLSGGLNNWYVVPVKNPQRKEQEPYQAECEDIIQALGMTFDEGCAFKALWRNAAARMGNGKPGNTTVYDCEKLVHYANRLLAKAFIDSKASAEAVKEEESCTDWVYSNERPSFMRKWKKIEYEYKNHCKTYTSFPGESQFQSIRWADIYRYRIFYR